MDTSGSVQVPAVGKVKKVYVYGAGALVAGIVAYAYWQRSRSGGELPDGGFYADTRTGSALGSDEYSNPGGAANSGAPPATGDDGIIRTDQDWTNRAVEKLSHYEQGYVTATAGKYLARQPLTPDEMTLIREIWAVVGRAPSNPPLVPVPPTKPAPKPTTPAPKPTTPAPKPNDPKANDPKNLRMSKADYTGIGIGWDAGKGVAWYRVFVNGKHKKSTKATHAYISGLKAGTKYTVRVDSVLSTGGIGGSVSAQMSTKKKN